MSSKTEAIRAARAAANRNGKPAYIYRVGPAWMYTTEANKEATQAAYKVTIQDYEAIQPGFDSTPQTTRLASLIQRFIIDVGPDITTNDLFVLFDNALKERGMRIAAEQRGIRGTFIHVVKEP